MSAFGKFSFFKEDSAIPDFVRAWFDAMLPIGIVVCSGWILVDVLHLDIYNSILSIFKPIAGFMESWYGFILVVSWMIFCFQWVSQLGIDPVTKPVSCGYYS
jgi:PTS system cellobiose-specific IIC component